MAATKNVIRMVLSDRDLGIIFPLPSTDVYAVKWEAEDRSWYFLEIFGTGAPSTNYPEAPVGSRYTDLATGTLYRKTNATTWA